MNNKPKASIFFDYRKPITHEGVEGRCHIKILVTFYDRGIRQRRYFKTHIFATAAEFKKIMSGKFGKSSEVQDDLGKKRDTLLDLEKKAKQCLADFTNADDFETGFYSKGNYENPLDLMLAYANEMEQAGRIGNRDYYMQARSSFLAYVTAKFNGRLSFSQVTVKFLMGYEQWMLSLDKSITTVGMYCIAMRTVFNLAIRKKVIPVELYPFGKGKHQIPTAKGRKLALTEIQKDKLLKYKSSDVKIWRALDMWIFSYYCHGMNFADMAMLRFQDIQDNCIVFDRAKTARTERNKEYVPIEVRKEVQDIINRWGNEEVPGNFVFPVLRDGLSPKQIADRIHDFIKDTNEALALACPKIGIPVITTYWARHTFATIMRNKKVSTAMIQKMLGHASETTTQNYFGSFPLEDLKDATSHL